MKNDGPVFQYGQTEIAYLSGRDPLLGEAIARLGHLKRPVRPDLFEALISSIVSQQISGKAYQTVWSRLLALTGGITPSRLARLPREDLKSCGLSYKKTDWILTAAQWVEEGRADLEQLRELPDQRVIDELILFPGIGVWSAEMLLLFSLQRPDILSFGDLAIRRGIKQLYGLEELTKDEFRRIKARLSPFNSVASLYFWEISAKPEHSSVTSTP